MKIKFLTTILALFAALSIFGQTRKVNNFSTLSTSGGVKVELIKSNEEKLEFTMQKGDASDLITEVKEGTLKIKIKKHWGFGNARASIKLYYKNLNAIHASAGSSINSKETINADKLILSCSSGASIQANVMSNHADIDASSGASISIYGSVKETAKIDASSGSNIQATDLIIKSITADVSSGANITCHPIEKLNADASSGGSISYKGSPSGLNVISDKSSGGSIKKI